MILTDKTKLNYFGWLVVGFMILSSVLVNNAIAEPLSEQTTFYFVRHAEIDKQNADKPLNSKGLQRAEALVDYLKQNQITHIYASHTDRTRDTVKPLSNSLGISIVQSPKPGSTINGEIVNNRTKGKIAIKPLISTLSRVPKGSSVVVAANSGNLFGIMAGLGVPVVGENAICSSKPSKCLPCKAKKCFPKKEFNNVWIVTIDGNGKANLARTTYGN